MTSPVTTTPELTEQSLNDFFDVTSNASLSHACTWMQEAIRHAPLSSTQTGAVQKLIVFLVANKIDLLLCDEADSFILIRARSIAAAQGFHFRTASAKFGRGVSELFHAVGAELLSSSSTGDTTTSNNNNKAVCVPTSSFDLSVDCHPAEHAANSNMPPPLSGLKMEAVSDFCATL